MPIRQLTAAVAVMLMGAVYFAPGIPDNMRQITALSLLLLSVLITRHREPATEPNSPRRIWDERDSGERFSMIMVHVLIGSSITFLVWQQVQMATGPNGAWWQFVLAGLVTVSSIWAVWQNWSSRNAR
jgi:magnesium-transporting ATPase (P-type)